jgi:hypothetical protein
VIQYDQAFANPRRLRYHNPLPTLAVPPPLEVMRRTRPPTDAVRRKSPIRATGDTETVVGREIMEVFGSSPSIVFAERERLCGS